MRERARGAVAQQGRCRVRDAATMPSLLAALVEAQLSGQSEPPAQPGGGGKKTTPSPPLITLLALAPRLDAIRPTTTCKKKCTKQKRPSHPAHHLRSRQTPASAPHSTRENPCCGAPSDGLTAGGSRSTTAR